ncbi:MAG TPA: tetratricopeptide repeat protein [Coriobacteriia bacterium]
MDDSKSIAPDAGSAPSPFGRHDTPADRWIKTVTWLVAAAIVIVAAYLGYSYYSDVRLRDTQSPSARAVANLAAIVSKSPNLAMARVRLAEAMMANGQQAEAITQLEAALKIEKDNSAALTDLGLIAMQRSEWVNAEAYWTKLVTILSTQEMAGQDQRLADVYYYLGTTFVEEKRYEEAVANLKESIKIKRDSSPVHYMLSVAYQRLSLQDMQEEELTIVLAFDPSQAQANYDMGLIKLKQGDVAGAAELFRISADLAPQGVDDPSKQLDLLGKAADHLAEAVRLQASDPTKALSEARIAAALEPTNVPAVRLAAQLWEVNKDPKRAQNAWERLIELAPGDVMATDAIKRLSANAK